MRAANDGTGKRIVRQQGSAFRVSHLRETCQIGHAEQRVADGLDDDELRPRADRRAHLSQVARIDERVRHSPAGSFDGQQRPGAAVKLILTTT